MLLADVSGRQKNSKRQTGPDSHKISHNDQRQLFQKQVSRQLCIELDSSTHFSATTAKPDSIGPSAGAANMAETQTDTASGR